MNITIGRGRNNGFKHGKAPYIVAVCGIAIVVAVAILGTTWGTNTQQATPSTGVTPLRYAQSEQAPQTIIFVVASEEEAVKLDAALSADSYNWVSPIQTQIMVVDTPEKERALATTQLELFESGFSYQLADIRQPLALPPIVSAEQSVVDNALNDRIMQGVISSEHAAWSFDDTAPPATSPAQ